MNPEMGTNLYEPKTHLIVLICLIGVCSLISIPMILSQWDIYPTRMLNPHHSNTSQQQAVHEFWLVKLSLNLLGYATIFVPLYSLSLYLKKVKYNERAGKSYFSRIIRLCVFDGDEKQTSEYREVPYKDDDGFSPHSKQPQNGCNRYLLFIACCLGLQASYLTWGVIQERIMTQDYGGERFRDSQFLVFINRVLAGGVAFLVLCVQARYSSTYKSDYNRVALLSYSYSSISNILSSWFQYEALKYVSFPTQVLAKAGKIIPVMLMGRIVSKRSHRLHEYITAAMISGGVALFLLTNSESKHISPVTTISGVLLLIGYMLFDSFTSNWQDKLFKKHRITPIQMMAYTNMWSCCLTLTTLLEQGHMTGNIAFMIRWPRFSVDVFLLSLCSALGQLFIFVTIHQFGAVTFVILMTVRQALAILLSCMIYSHPITGLGISGIFVVFVAIFLRIWLNQRFKSATKYTATVLTNNCDDQQLNNNQKQVCRIQISQ